MIVGSELGVGMSLLGDRYTIAMRALILGGVFVLGWLEGAVFKMKRLASVTWFWGLAALAIWIAYPLTIARICVAGIVFVLGLTVLIAYYRGAKISGERRG